MLATVSFNNVYTNVNCMEKITFLDLRSLKPHLAKDLNGSNSNSTMSQVETVERVLAKKWSEKSCIIKN